MVGHSLIVPNPEKLLNQVIVYLPMSLYFEVLRNLPLQLALQTVLLSADA